ncbi:DUF951 family protein [Spiroplasma endosymbiont of Dioctria linearis]|uniref:DUF951 family protein n=1 Tax=Spiroplasma endosymbiont of Dioctria linearis TaxID=3066290 RepID=UPI00313D77D1
MKINLGDKVFLKKPHPSKTIFWIVLRIGTIYKLQSNIDEKIILEFQKDDLLKKIKKVESGK